MSDLGGLQIISRYLHVERERERERGDDLKFCRRFKLNIVYLENYILVITRFRIIHLFTKYTVAMAQRRHFLHVESLFYGIAEM